MGTEKTSETKSDAAPWKDAHGFDIKSRLVQAPLFGDDEASLLAHQKSFRKAVSAIHAVPQKAEHRHTLNSRRMLDSIIMLFQAQYRNKTSEEISKIIDDRVSPLLEVRVSDLAKAANIQGKNNVRLYETLNHLYEMDLRWNIVGEDSAVIWDMKARFLSLLAIGKGKNAGRIKLAVEPAVLSIVLDPKMWATLQLQVIKGLRTETAYALFQAAWRYVGTQAKVTSSLPVETWIDIIIGPSRHVQKDPDTGERVVVDYNDFKRRLLNPAIEVINSISALNYILVLKEVRAGRRVTRLQFQFIAKQQENLVLPVTWSEDMMLALSSLGYSGDETIDLSQAYNMDEVADSLQRLKSADEKLRAKGRRITSKKAFFEGILDNVAAGRRESEQEIEDLENKTRSREAERLAGERRERAISAFEQHQHSVFTTSLFGLDEGSRKAILDEFESSDRFDQVRVLLGDGWTPKGRGALTILRAWLKEVKNETWSDLLPNPEDKAMDSWMTWKMESQAN